MLWLAGPLGGTFLANGKNLAGLLLQKSRKIWNRDRFECKYCKSKRRLDHKLWPLWQNADGSMWRNFQKFINFEISTCCFLLERTLSCEGRKVVLLHCVKLLWTRGQNWGCADGPARLQSKRVTNLQRQNNDVELNSVTVGQTERRCEWDAKKSLGVDLPSVSILHCLSSPCSCLSSHYLWLTSIVEYYPGCISYTHATWLSKSLAARHDAVLALYPACLCPVLSVLPILLRTDSKRNADVERVPNKTAGVTHHKSQASQTNEWGYSFFWIVLKVFCLFSQPGPQTFKRNCRPLCIPHESRSEIQPLHYIAWNCSIFFRFWTFQMQEQIVHSGKHLWRVDIVCLLHQLLEQLRIPGLDWWPDMTNPHDVSLSIIMSHSSAVYDCNYSVTYIQSDSEVCRRACD